MKSSRVNLEQALVTSGKFEGTASLQCVKPVEDTVHVIANETW